MAIFALIAGYRDAKKHEGEMADLHNQLTEQKNQLIEQKGINLGSASVIGRRLEDIANKVSDPRFESGTFGTSRRSRPKTCHRLRVL